jgi:multidrug efflux pump subunit AcrA (membrane-fusion protein)
MKDKFDGVIVGEEVEVRFAFSGKVSWVGKKLGDTVKQWEAIASLDRKILQTQLDLELADYEKVRADFEIFGIKNGKDGGDDVMKFLRQEKQSQLNASVKQVEVAKYNLDQADMICPVNGIILGMSNLAPGLHVTPAGSSVTVGKTDGFVFRFTVNQEDIEHFLKPITGMLKITGVEKEQKVTTSPPVWGKDGEFTVNAVLTETAGVLPGMKGSLHITG